MKIIKRNGSEVTFDVNKIENAIRAANLEVPEEERLSERSIKFAALNVTDECMEIGHTVTVEEVQDLVEDQLMALDHFQVARRYIIYRYVQAQKRQKNMKVSGYPTADKQFVSELLKFVRATFDPKKLLYASNWPVVKLYSSFDEHFQILRDEFGDDENFFMNNAVRAYGLKIK